MDSERKVAVLFDAENIASKYTPVILNEANALGSVIIRRIYGDWTAREMSSWKQVILDHSIQPIQQYRNVSGKNSSDSALIIDAMDLLYQGRVDAFCIVSSDSDFTRLAARLREAGIGEAAIASVHTPIGTPIKAVTPEEIAVSIAGEMICVRAERREAAGVKQGGCPMHGEPVRCI